MKITREVKASILVLSAIALLIFGYSFLKGKNLLKTDRVFYAMYDNVEGLTTSSPVTINGFKVGKVLKIEFADAKGKLTVTFSVTNDFKFGKNSTAKIYSMGFVEGNGLAIVPEKNPKIFAKSNDFLKSHIELGMIDAITDQLSPLQNKIETVLTKTDVLIASLNKILSEENAIVLGKSLKDLSSSLNSLKYTTGTAQSLISENQLKLSQTISNFNEASVGIKTLSTKLSNAPVDDLIRKLDASVATFSGIAANLKAGKGSAGKFLNDNEVYDNLDRATKQLDMLLQDMKLNPKRYVHFSVFGKRNKDYKKPKDSLQ
ncbi:MlaD family protein [Aquimarina agarivorans]|uniref:MlaD family protein n=1 Tax=Aquimarina agarivorans TaxID=980584 RepID=UPI000248FACE|nr:MlaD family protein [Aquimarina agarivorans]